MCKDDLSRLNSCVSSGHVGLLVAVESSECVDSSLELGDSSHIGCLYAVCEVRIVSCNSDCVKSGELISNSVLKSYEGVVTGLTVSNLSAVVNSNCKSSILSSLSCIVSNLSCYNTCGKVGVLAAYINGVKSVNLADCVSLECAELGGCKCVAFLFMARICFFICYNSCSFILSAFSAIIRWSIQS